VPDPHDPSRALQLARETHLAGRLAEAEPLYRRVLAEHSASGDALHGLSVLALQLGRNEAALQWIDQAIAADQSDPRYHCTRGQILAALNRLDDSIGACRRAIELRPRYVDAMFGLGLALHAKGEREQAMDAYRRTLELKPDHVEALNNLANALQVAGRLGEAIDAYRRALAARPNFLEAQNNLGGALQAAGRLDEAVAVFRQALAARPDFVPLHINLGVALMAKRQLDEAITVLRHATELNPDFSQSWYNLGNALRDKGQWSEAAAAYRKAVALRPQYVEAHNNLGNVLQSVGEFKEAADAYLAALAVRPDFTDAYTNIGAALQKMGHVDHAIALLRQALSLRPDFHVAYCNLGNLLKDSGQLDEALACYRRAVELKRADAISHSNLAFAVHYHPDYGGSVILRENLRWNAMHAQRFAAEIRPHENDRDPDRRLRIGYVSPDFREHCQSLFTIPLLSRHDHQRFEIFCYANVSRPDAVTQRVSGYADVWRPTNGFSDAAVAEMVRTDRIDILVDLTMHMSNGRPLVFARKPAPVQVAWLAYPGTTGLLAMDYRLTDRQLDPPEFDLFYSEKSIRLPDSFWCYDPLATEPHVNELPAATGGRVTFGCLNNFCKVTEGTLALWAKVLAAVPDSRLLLLCAPGAHQKRVADRLGAQVEFVEFRPRSEYLKLYHRIDLGLDTFPYNGHTTSLDSLWMGVPVITKLGNTAVGRAGYSQLSNLNLRELVAQSDEEFVQIAVNLANDLPRLADLRMNLRQRTERSPLMDAERFARNVETAFRRMWQAWVTQSSAGAPGLSPRLSPSGVS
jgi:protein O-GlcNAc transferase